MLRPWRGLAALALVAAACTPADTVDGRAPVQTSTAARGGATDLPAGVGFRRFTHTWGDGGQARISVITVAPDADVRVEGVHGKHVATAETVRSMADRAGAVAAVNGSFFDIASGGDFSGYAGDPLGVYALGGTLLSEAAQGGMALVLGPRGSRPRVTRISTALSVTAGDGAVREVDGVNRVPGRILGCGGVGGDVLRATGQPRSAPMHNRLCVDTGEIVRFTPDWGANSPPGKPGSAEAVLDAAGHVTGQRRPAGGPIPPGGSTLYGQGEGAQWLTAHARPGSTVASSTSAADLQGRSVLSEGVSLIGGGPGLVQDGRPDIGLAASGFSSSALTHRDPRTLAGVGEDGTLLLVVVDGRTTTSVGATLGEAASLMVSLGAVSAMNLDGGGSSTAVVAGTVRNRPMSEGENQSTERPVATAVAVVP